MTERKENRSARRSKRLIRQAFQELLAERGFHKITVTDIVDRADLNRSTFYAHYQDIYAIVDEMQEEIIQRNMELFQQIAYRNILKNPKPYLDCIGQTMAENLELMQSLGLSENRHRKIEKLRDMMEHDIMNHSDIPREVRESISFSIRVHFFLAGVIDVYQRWTEGKLNCTLDVISSHISELVLQSANGFLEADRNGEI